MPTFVIPASVPPASMTSARLRRIASIASPMAMFEAAHAVHSDASGPRVPSSIETQAAPMLGMIAVIAERVDAVGPALEQLVVAVLEALEPADAGGNGDACALGLALDVDARVLLGHAGGGDDHLGEAVHPARLAVLDPLRRLEVLQLAGEVDGVLGGVEGGDRGGAALSGGQVLPEGLGIVAERRHCAHARDDDPCVRCSKPSLHPQSTVDEQHIARDERGLVGTEKSYRSGYVLRRSRAGRAACCRGWPRGSPPRARRSARWRCSRARRRSRARRASRARARAPSSDR